MKTVPHLLIETKKDTLVAAENEKLIHTAVEKLGGLDIIIANAGWTRFTRPGDIYDMSHDEWNKVHCLL
jgi:NAD(P)-dependent dehydrogenase (short-subunit alcohol dehydrogenase family)